MVLVLGNLGKRATLLIERLRRERPELVGATERFLGSFDTAHSAALNSTLFALEAWTSPVEFDELAWREHAWRVGVPPGRNPSPRPRAFVATPRRPGYRTRNAG